VQGLVVTFREKDPWGTSVARQLAVSEPLMRMNFDRQVNTVATDVWDPQRGFLELSNAPYAFIRAIQTDFSFTRKTVVRTDDETFEVMRSGKPEKRTAVGAANHVSTARSRLLTAHFARERRRAAESQDQRWFQDQRDEARALLRSLLAGARREVLVIDPYFGATELAAFTLAVARHDIPIRILTAAETLKAPVDDGSEMERGDQLLDLLQQLRQRDDMNTFEIRVMRGSRPAVHDRFLVVDDRIWLLGSSLNEFGSRGTMLLALPDPGAVRDDLTRAAGNEESDLLEDWRATRRQTKGQGEPS
jgi:hypothetical protein